MLEMTISTRFAPGTNLSGGLARADWRYLLPTQVLDQLLCVGTPAIETVAVLGSICRQISVIEKNPAKRAQLSGAAALQHLDIHFVDDHATLADDPPSPSYNLIYITQSTAAAFWREPQSYASVLDHLAPLGMVYCEAFGRASKAESHKLLRHLDEQNIHLHSRYWLTPFSGDLRTAVPVGNRHAAGYFFRNVLYGQSLKKRTLSRVGHFLSATGLIDTAVPRHALLMARTNGNASTSPPDLPALPRYLMEIAARHGFDFADYTFAFSARGKYNSNKVIFFLFNRVSHRAEIVIKMTRSAAFNGRLKNEFLSLNELKSKHLAEQKSYPGPLFYDEHNGLALLAIKAVYGAPFRARTRAKPDCPIAANAARWLTALGERSVNPDCVTPQAAANTLGQLFEQFRNIYALPSAELRFLENQISRIAMSAAPFPTVFQHGDPGIWNMLVRENNEVIVIDWEAGEQQGAPLWDLLYFYRTFASWVARQQGSNDPVENFTAHFLHPTSVNTGIARDVRTYCETIHLAHEHLQPLFYTCWMHRALKESMRLKEESLMQGTFVNILRRCIQTPDSPGLRAIWGAEVRTVNA